jgi:EAL domain-containing protein (putative c-di-GMP-specific phosphodiesterase class I)
MAVGERLLASIAAPIDIAGTRLAITASAGLAAASTSTLSDALRNADASMYEAKRQGRARLHAYDQSVAERAASMLQLSTALRLALYDDPAQLDVHYQPIVTLDGNTLVAVEALARWRHPELGPIPPGRFVDVAQQAGLSARLDVLTMQRSFRDHADLVRRGLLDPATRVAVNVAAAHLADGNVGDEILRASYEAGLLPRQLVVEVGDHAVLRDVGVARKALERLQAQGALIALDEFGAGMSSLTSLRRLPVDVLKIDRVFVRNLVSDSEDVAIVASLIDLAHALGVTVVAEGVETPVQRQLLVDLGCDQAQGYLWSAPVPAGELPDALADLVGRSRAADAIERLRPRSAGGPGAVGRANGLLRMLELRREGRSAATIAAALNAEGYRTPEGVRWHRGTIARALVAAMECPDSPAASKALR